MRVFAIGLALSVVLGCSSSRSVVPHPRSAANAQTTTTSVVSVDDDGMKESPCGPIGGTTIYPFVRVGELIGTRLYPLEEYRGRFTADRRSRIVICVNKSKLAEHPIYSQGAVSLAARIGSRNIEVQGYAEVGKNYERFRASTLQSDRISTDYRTIVDSVNEVVQILEPARPEIAEESSLAATRADVASLVLGNLLSRRETARALSRILTVSLTDLRARRRTLATALTDFRKARQDATTAAADLRNLERQIRELRQELSPLDQRIAAATNTVTTAATDEARATAEQELSTLRERRTTISFNLRQMEERLSALEDPVQWLQRTRNSLRLAAQDVLRKMPPLSDIEARIVDVTNDLKDGSIVLEEQDAKAGDLLSVSLLHFPPLNDEDAASDDAAATAASSVTASTAADSADNEETEPSTETLALIEIQEYGFASTVADSFLLIKRLNEPEQTDPPSTSPSNFKGGAGVSLLWSRHARPSESRVLRALRPSWGVNVSYLDFDASKEIEIGAGLVAGLFRDQVHVGCGWNLNVTDSRQYCFVGFSFAKIKENLDGDSAE